MGEGDLFPGQDSCWCMGRRGHRGAIGTSPIPEAPPKACWQIQAWIGSGKGHRDRRIASTPAMAAAAAKNIAKRSASYAHAKPRLNKETNAIMVRSRTLAPNPCPPFCPRRTIPSNKIDRGRGNMRAWMALR
jgi:hypothetical protein